MFSANLESKILDELRETYNIGGQQSMTVQGGGDELGEINWFGEAEFSKPDCNSTWCLLEVVHMILILSERLDDGDNLHLPETKRNDLGPVHSKRLHLCW